MRMSPWRYVMMRMSLWGYVMMWISPWGYDANVFTRHRCNNQEFLLFSNQCFLWAWSQNIFQNLTYSFQMSFSVYSGGLDCPVHHFCPQKKFYFDLRFSQNWWSLLEFSEWDINLGSNDLVWKDLFPQVGWEKGECFFSRPFREIKILWKSAVLKNNSFFVPEYDDLIKHQDLPW